MEIDKALETVKEIDRITKENPAILLLIREMKERGSNVVPITDQFVSQKVAAKILGTSVGTLCKMVKANKIGVWILPGQTERKYRLSELYRFMDKCKVVKQNDDSGTAQTGRGKATVKEKSIAV